MAATLIFCTVSVDGYAVGPDDDLSRLHRWLDGIGTAPPGSAAAQHERFRSAGAIVFGHRTWLAGQEPWGDDHVFDSPVFVLAHEARPPIGRNGTTYTFVTTGVRDADARAHAAAAGGDVVIMGSPDVARQFLQADLVDELALLIVPVLLGRGTRLFGELAAPRELTLTTLIPGEEVSAAIYAVNRSA
jgi:dihydrofolate reductase